MAHFKIHLPPSKKDSHSFQSVAISQPLASLMPVHWALSVKGSWTNPPVREEGEDYWLHPLTKRLEKAINPWTEQTTFFCSFFKKMAKTWKGHIYSTQLCYRHDSKWMINVTCLRALQTAVTATPSLPLPYATPLPAAILMIAAFPPPPEHFLLPSFIHPLACPAVLNSWAELVRFKWGDSNLLSPPSTTPALLDFSLHVSAWHLTTLLKLSRLPSVGVESQMDREVHAWMALL